PLRKIWSSPNDLVCNSIPLGRITSIYKELIFHESGEAQMTARNGDAGVVYVNGEYLTKSDAKVSVFDQGFIFGDGVYDTMVAKNGFLFKLEEHVERLFNSAKAVKLTIPMSKEMLEEK